jgi:hypothetical protein
MFDKPFRHASHVIPFSSLLSLPIKLMFTLAGLMRSWSCRLTQLWLPAAMLRVSVATMRLCLNSEIFDMHADGLADFRGGDGSGSDRDDGEDI